MVRMLLEMMKEFRCWGREERRHVESVGMREERKWIAGGEWKIGKGCSKMLLMLGIRKRREIRCWEGYEKI